MKAIVQTGYGPYQEVLDVREVEPPVPNAGQVLVRVFAASLHADVWHVVRGRPWVLRLMGSGLNRPRQAVIGTDFAGVVESLGPGVTQFEPGDEVFGESHTHFQWVNGGACAELATVPVSAITNKPKNVSFAQAATVPVPGFIAVQNLKSAGTLPPDASVLVNGAAGGVGAIALQLLVARGATVTAVDEEPKLDLLTRLGAHRVIDYRSQPVLENDAEYDLVLDVASTLEFAAVRKRLSATGKYIWIGHDHFGKARGPLLGSIPAALGLLARSRFDRHLPQDMGSVEKKPVMEELAHHLAQGTLTPIIAQEFPLERFSEAFQALEQGSHAGRLVFTPAQSEK